MPDVRPINEKKYEISKHRFIEGSRSSGESGSATEHLVIRRMKLRERCELIEQTAIEADPDLYPYILEGVTAEYASYKYLRQVKEIPCGKNMYYDRRRKFYWLLSKKI